MNECRYTSAAISAFAVWTGTVRTTENILDVYYESPLFNAV